MITKKKLLLHLFVFLWLLIGCSFSEAAWSIRGFSKEDYPVDDAILTGVHPNVLFLLDTGSPMVFTPKGLMPDVGDGRTTADRIALLKDATYGSGTRPASRNGVEGIGVGGGSYNNWLERYGRDLDPSNNIIGDPDCYYTPDPSKPYFLTFRDPAWANWNGQGSRPAVPDYIPSGLRDGFSSFIARYLPGGSKEGIPISDDIPSQYQPYVKDFLVPNDSRMYQMKLVLWRILGQANAPVLSGMRTGLSITYREDQYPDSLYADYYFGPYHGANWDTQVWGPSWSGFGHNDLGNAAYSGVLRTYYDNPVGSDNWNRLNRSILLAPFDYLYTMDAEGEYHSTARLETYHEYIDGVEDGDGTNWINRELYADGKTPLATSIFGRKFYLNKMDGQGRSAIFYASQLTSGQNGRLSYPYSSYNFFIPLSTSLVSADLRTNSQTIRTGQAVGSVVDFFSPESSKLNFDTGATSDTRGFFPVMGSCQSNWLVVFTSANDSYPDYSAAEAVTDLFNTTKDSMRGRQWDGSQWLEKNFAMDSGVRTLVVGFVNKDSTDSVVLKLRESLNEMAQAGDPIVSQDGSYAPNPSATAYFAENVPELVTSLTSILTRINADKFAAGAPVVLPLYSDSKNQKVVFSSSYKIKTMDQWDGWFKMYVMSGDYDARLRWEFNDEKLVPTIDTRDVFTTEAERNQPGLTISKLGGFQKERIEALTGVPVDHVPQFVEWLRKYDSTQIMGDMEHSGLVIVSEPKSEALLQNPDIEIRSRDHVIYIQTNRGVLHAIDYDTGQEKWAFIPPNIFQPRMKALKFSNEDVWYSGNGVNTRRSEAFALLDGPLVAKDLQLDNASEFGTIMVGNLGWGGNGFYAMDVTKPGDSPNFLWAVDNARYLTKPADNITLWGRAATQSQTDYSALGLTIAPPVLALAPVSTTDHRNVGFLPGGLGYNLGDDDQGKIFYVFSPSNGSIIRALTESNGFEGPTSLGMGIAPVTQTEDAHRNLTALYTGDSEGNVLYCDTTKPVSAWTLKSVFQLTNNANEPVVIPKSVLVGKASKRNELWLFGGSAGLLAPDQDLEGYQRGLQNAQNYIFGFNLTKTSSDFTLSRTDLAELKYALDDAPFDVSYGVTLEASDNKFNPDDIKGWCLPLRPQLSGTMPEYVTTAPYMYYGVLYVSTFIPSVRMTNDYDVCPDLGHSKFYALNPLTGTGMWGGGVQSIVIKDVKITGISALDGRIYVGVKPLKSTALTGLPHQVSGGAYIFPDKTQFSFPAPNYFEQERVEIEPNIPYIQYWRDTFQ